MASTWTYWVKFVSSLSQVNWPFWAEEQTSFVEANGIDCHVCPIRLDYLSSTPSYEENWGNDPVRGLECILPHNLKFEKIYRFEILLF